MSTSRVPMRCAPSSAPFVRMSCQLCRVQLRRSRRNASRADSPLTLWGASPARACANRRRALHFSPITSSPRHERNTPFSETDAPHRPACTGQQLAGNTRADSCETFRHPHVRPLRPGRFLTSQKSNFHRDDPTANRARQSVARRLDQRCTPTFSAVWPNDRAPGATGQFGLYHLTNAGDCPGSNSPQAILDLRGDPRPIQPSHGGVRFAAAGPVTASCMRQVRSLGLAPLRPEKRLGGLSFPTSRL